MLLKWICIECGNAFEKDSSIINPICPICSSSQSYDNDNETIESSPAFTPENSDIWDEINEGWD